MRKLLFIDLRYHEKTGSAQFLIDLLKTRYRVEIQRDDLWQTYAGLSRINRERYDAILFWQVKPFIAARYFDCQNIIFFPMFDSHGELDTLRIGELPQLGVISFCSALHKKLSGIPNDRLCIKYYPKPLVSRGDELAGNGLFFWQRGSDVTWRTVRRIIGECPELGGVHLHRSVDPGASWQAPTSEEEQAYHISYSDWFQTKEDYLTELARNALYVAPRSREGIGMSFLEALAMAKGVLAHDGPTMNEYIVHGENGYLFDCANPKPVDLGELNRIRRSALESVYEGWLAWEQDEFRIIDFLEARMRDRREPRASAKLSIRRKNIAYATIRIFRLLKKSIRWLGRRTLFIWTTRDLGGK